MSKKKPAKTSIIAQIERDPVGDWVLSLFRPHFHEVQFIVLLTAVLSMPVNGRPLIKTTFDYLVQQFGAALSAGLSVLLLMIFVTLFFGGLILLCAKLVMQRRLLNIGQKCGVLLLVYFALFMSYGFGMAFNESDSQGVVHGVNNFIALIAYWVIQIRFFTTWFAAKVHSARMIGFMTKNFSDKQASLGDILLAIGTTLVSVLALVHFGHEGSQVILLGYVYGFASYRFLDGLLGYVGRSRST